jgi:gluconate 2-dehydrogenase gamma chain
MRATEDGDRRSAGGLRRRDLLRRSGLLGAVAILPARAGTADAAPAVAAQPERLYAFAAAESDLLNAVLARLIPTDASGPGATEARVGRYIDQALAGDEKAVAPLFQGGLAALDEYARSAYGAVFTGLPPDKQDAVLGDLEAAKPTNFPPPGAGVFFATVREFALQGMFCDPEQGGNANFVGWDLLGYPGVKLAWNRRDQRNAKLRPAHKSAGDFALFKPGPKGASDHGH